MIICTKSIILLLVNRQKNHAINMNNMLVKQYIRAILELNPKAFVKENVSMLKSDVHRFYLTEDDKERIRKYHIPVKETNLILLDEEFSYDEPSGTVVNVRKSMWIHPTKDRAISIREAARLQTFPDSFVFCGSKDKQYQQVGNAVPPIMAKAIATKIVKYLNENKH